MKFKKFMALALAGVMTFAMAGSVYAAPEDESAAESEAVEEEVPTNPLSGDIIKKTLMLNEGVTVPAETFTFTFTSVSTNPEGITAPKIPNVTIAYSEADTYSANGIVKTAKIKPVDDDSIIGKTAVISYVTLDGIKSSLELNIVGL